MEISLQYFQRFLVAFIVTLLGHDALAAGCDPCVQGTVKTATTTLENVLDADIQSVKANIKAAEALKTSIDTYKEAVTTGISINSTFLESSIDAMTKRVTAAIEKGVQADTKLTDAYNLAFKQMMTEERLAKNNYKNMLEFDPAISNPVSSYIGLSSAPYVKAGLISKQTLLESMINDFDSWLENSDIHHRGGLRIKREQLLDPEVGISNWNISELATSNEISAERAKEMQTIFKLITSESPLQFPKDNSGAKGLDQALKMTIKKHHLTLVYSVFADLLTNKVEQIKISDDTWNQYYVRADEDGNNLTSIEAYKMNQSIGKLMSQQWLTDISLKSDAGLLREAVNQQAVQNALLLDLVNKEEARNLLAAIALSKKINHD
jgi:hypothetical protein